MPYTAFRKQSHWKAERSPEKQPNVRVNDSFVIDMSGCGCVLVWEKVDGTSTYFCLTKELLLTEHLTRGNRNSFECFHIKCNHKRSIPSINA